MLSLTDWTGSIGVTTLLLAFLLNLLRKISQDSLSYILLNITGAGLACLACILLDYLPFIILEGAWTLVSVFALIKWFKRGSSRSF